MGIYWMPICESIISTRTVTMKGQSQYRGEVIIELNRYLVIRNSEGKLTALQSSEILAMDFLDRYSRANPTPEPPASPNASITPGLSASPAKSPAR
jgi:hypothetical protein